jgi:hypothetical protein
LSMAALGGGATPSKAPVRKHCTAAKQHCKTVKPKPKKKPVAKVKPREDGKPNTQAAPRDDTPSSPGERPSATPTPTATPKPGATATPEPTVTPVPTATPDPVKYPSRTGVDLTEWEIRSSYRTLATGRVVFSANNLGEDDHNLSVRSGATEYGKVDVAPGDNTALVLQLTPGTYTLYCSLTGHEESGMRTDITVR